MATRSAPILPNGARPWRVAVAVAAALLAAVDTRPASAGDAPPGADPGTTVAALSASTAFGAHQVARSDGSVTSIRTVQQTLALDAATVDGRFRAAVSFGYGYDAGLRALVANPLLAERQLDASLETAWLGWRPVGAVEARAGRFVDESLRRQRVDGASLRFAPTPMLTLQAAAGVRPAPTTTTMDGDWADRGAERALLHGRPGALLVGALARFGTADALGFVGWTEERLPTRGELLQRIARAGLTAGRRTGARATVDASLDTVTWRVETARSRLYVPLVATYALDFAGSYERAIFPLDSVFSVFPQTGAGRLELGLQHTTAATRWRVSTGSVVRREPSALAEVRSTHDTRYGSFDLSGRTDLAASRQVGLAAVSLRVPVSRGVDLEPAATGWLAQDESSRRGEVATSSVRLAQGFRFRMGAHGDAWARADVGWDGVWGWSWRCVARANLTLAVRRGQRGA